MTEWAEVHVGRGGTLPSVFNFGKRALLSKGRQSPSVQRFSHCSTSLSLGQLKQPSAPVSGLSHSGTGGLSPPASLPLPASVVPVVPPLPPLPAEAPGPAPPSSPPPLLTV